MERGVTSWALCDWLERETRRSRVDGRPFTEDQPLIQPPWEPQEPWISLFVLTPGPRLLAISRNRLVAQKRGRGWRIERKVGKT